MRVILATDAIFPPLTGIGRYTLELATRLPRQPALEGVRYLGMFSWQGGARGGEAVEPGVVPMANPHVARLRRYMASKEWPVMAYDMFSERWRAQLLKAGRGAVYHSPNYFLAGYDGPSVATVHDLSITKFPETHPAARRRYFDLAFERSLRRADALITDSEAIRQELIADFGVAPGKVKAIHLGVDPVFHPRAAQELQPVLQRYGLSPGAYLLSVSTLEPRKRLDQLIAAYAGLSPAIQKRFPLVLIGTQGWLNDKTQPLIAQGTSQGWLRYLGYVPQADLPLLYAGAHGFAMVSIYEGFGLPLLEAMASGVPVLTSDRSCMPEVTAGAALLANPDDVESIRAQLHRLVEDAPWRHAAIAKGDARAKALTWDACVDKTVAVYAAIAR